MRHPPRGAHDPLTNGIRTGADPFLASRVGPAVGSFPAREQTADSIMGRRVNGPALNFFGWLTTGAMFAAAVALVLTWGR